MFPLTDTCLVSCYKSCYRFLGGVSGEIIYTDFKSQEDFNSVNIFIDSDNMSSHIYRIHIFFWFDWR